MNMFKAKYAAVRAGLERIMNVPYPSFKRHIRTHTKTCILQAVFTVMGILKFIG